MKYFKIVIIIIIIAYFFPKSFVTYPGYMTQESYNMWESTKKHCYGFVYAPVREMADATENSWCIGMLI
ncbi:MAG: hypothetical protein KBB86_02000 [Candidatus Pacebacteria bacterium]|nr:hypothetical protein [Candidatus Paceibacterota bacterium]